jgi:prepilin-type processing-associated H-X9-DG protein
VELLVVIAIIVLLMSLILPAIQKVRESANKMLCASNMHQIGIAAHNYHTNYNKLPPGYLGPLQGAPNYQRAGVLAFLLPYVEQDKVFNQLVNTNPPNNKPFEWHLNVATQPWYNNVTDYNLARTRIKVYLCPSDQPYANTVGTGVFLNFNFPTISATLAPNPNDLGRSNYVGVNGSWGDNLPAGNPVQQYVGIFCNRSDVTLGQVSNQDGTSNTFMFAEYLGANDPTFNQPLERHYSGSWMGIGAAGTVTGMPNVPQPPWYCLGSRHKAGVQFCFADGSVRTVRRDLTDQIAISTEWTMLQELAGRKDGVSRDRSAILD